ncbi:lipopolysaccharide transport system ATP-binding protein [Pseudomonas sp. SORGH_AS 211]|uniref:ABC transporter ATP-binding protein n=1 Tax=Pseudomonas sp. SORGH_AS_0211 TaxID=3041796 RepID=UPI00286790F4|nr:ABC transporter ATP-binding protein [Pseudomonas sp. SORGH_AS_0211]MDR6180803.1 lipopolysaccharide transport system ATP-binding protein [Pseudomonas sp. SORGH_AS_0211]
MLRVSHVRKEFKLYSRPALRLKEILFRRSYHTRHVALEDISFEVRSGETLGILGRNGAGKSTLLKILNGVLLPDGGEIDIKGRVTGLLELGTGFDGNLTGVQNILGNGLLLGMNREEIEAKRDAIIEFSELGRFIDEPIRTYSSGMVMRLAFSIAIHADPDIFLVDEALSVGDGHFQQKCMRRIKAFRASGGSIIFISHDLNAMKMLCDRCIVLSEGRVVADDTPEAAVNRYNQLLGADREELEVEAEESGYGTGEARIESAVLRGVGSGSDTLACGDVAHLDVRVSAREHLPDATLGMMIRDRFGQDIYGTNSFLLGVPLVLAAGETRVLRYEFPMRLAPGKYTLTLALHEGPDHTRHCYHWRDNCIRFEVAGILGSVFGGLCDLSAGLHDVTPVSQPA